MNMDSIPLRGLKRRKPISWKKRCLGQLTNYAAPVIRRLLEFASPRLSGEEFEWLTIFAASLEMRNPKNIGEMKDMMDSELKDDPHLGDEVYRKLLESNSEIVTNETLQNLGVFIVNTARTFRTELKYWRVEDFTGGRKHLLLSDFRVFGPMESVIQMWFLRCLSVPGRRYWDSRP